MICSSPLGTHQPRLPADLLLVVGRSIAAGRFLALYRASRAEGTSRAAAAHVAAKQGRAGTAVPAFAAVGSNR